MAKLEVYVSGDCWSCAETYRIVDKVALQFPEVMVDVVEAGTGRWPNYVFASPTYVLNGRVISLGNPGWEELTRKLKAVQRVA